MMAKEKDLGVKIGTPTEVLWTKVKKEAEILLKQSEDNLLIQQGILGLCDLKIAQEKEKFK
jgi:hypothetical protein